MTRSLVRSLTTAVAAAAVLATPLIAPSTASAASCDRTNWSTHTYGKYFASGYKIAGGPGVTLTLKKNKAFTVNAGIQTTVGASAKVIVAEVKAETSLSIGASWSSTVEEGASWKVPKSYERGIFAAGAYKYKVTVTNDVRLPNCKKVRTDTGKTKVVERFTTYKHWKDS